jgi:hypothetical protein
MIVTIQSREWKTESNDLVKLEGFSTNVFVEMPGSRALMKWSG